MILSDSAVLAAMKTGDIVIDPFDRERLGPNSYDVTLGTNLLRVEPHVELGPSTHVGVDSAKAPILESLRIQPRGHWLLPGKLYLGVINEFTACSPKYVPMIDGTSSAGRLGLSIHVTAGRGDAGYAGHFTLEMHVVEPLKVYPSMPVGQVWWMCVDGEVERPYGARASSNYHSARREEDPMPKPSAMWKKLGKQHRMHLDQDTTYCLDCGTSDHDARRGKTCHGVRNADR